MEVQQEQVKAEAEAVQAVQVRQVIRELVDQV
jgi:hypothetical protein